MKKITLFLAAFALATAATAQDRIYRMNPAEVIEGRVLEVGEQSVRYTRADTRDDVVFNIPVQYLRRIVFEDGKELVYNDVVDVPGDRRDAIKLGLFSPVWNATTLYYERSLRIGQSIEFGLGVIGWGSGAADMLDREDERGVFLRAGYKFITRPEVYLSQFHYAHRLKGSYLKPELTLVHHRYKWPGGNGAYYRKQATLLNFGIVGGKQWVFQDILLLDIYAGLGVVAGGDSDQDSFHYAFTGNALTATAGFKIGLLLGKKR